MVKKYLKHIRIVLAVARAFSCQSTKTEEPAVNVA
jgi:hypothetical protein